MLCAIVHLLLIHKHREWLLYMVIHIVNFGILCVKHSVKWCQQMLLKKLIQKLIGFAAGYGTVLFFEDQEVVKSLQKQFASYADHFPVWSEHSSAIAQFAVWTALAEQHIGASLQHYHPVIDDEVAETFDIPKNWKLRAQLVFGSIEAPAGKRHLWMIKSGLNLTKFFLI